MIAISQEFLSYMYVKLTHQIKLLSTDILYYVRILLICFPLGIVLLCFCRLIHANDARRNKTRATPPTAPPIDPLLLEEPERQGKNYSSLNQYQSSLICFSMILIRVMTLFCPYSKYPGPLGTLN